MCNTGAGLGDVGTGFCGAALTETTHQNTSAASAMNLANVLRSFMFLRPMIPYRVAFPAFDPAAGLAAADIG